METQAISLNVHPQIIDLYEVLEKNGLHKQKEDVQSLGGIYRGVWNTTCP